MTINTDEPVTMKPFSFLTEVYPCLKTGIFRIEDGLPIAKNYLDDDSDISFRLVKIKLN